jgi:hypothetical protein
MTTTLQELTGSEVEIIEMKDIDPEKTESGAVVLDSVEPESEPVEIREKHDENRPLKITPILIRGRNGGNFDFNDPTSWPNVNDRIICCLVQYGPDQAMDADFCTSVSEDRRRFSLDWFSKKLRNKE